MPLMYIGFSLTLIALIISASVITFFGGKPTENAPSPLATVFIVAGFLVLQLVGSVAFGDKGIFVLGVIAALGATANFLTSVFFGKTITKK